MRICNERRRAGRGTVALLAGLMLVTPAAAGRYECLVEPFVEVRLSSGVPGRLAEVLVDRGETVAAGQVVARLESEVERAQVDLIRARAEFAERRLERNAELYLRQIISPDEKDQLETEAALLRLELHEASARLVRREVRSPIDGVVVERLFTAGEFVSDEPILRLAQIDPLRIETALPALTFGRVRVGSKGTVRWETGASGSHAATVTVVDPIVDAASGTIGVRLELPNPDRKLPAGTKCWVTMP